LRFDIPRDAQVRTADPGKDHGQADAPNQLVLGEARREGPATAQTDGRLLRVSRREAGLAVEEYDPGGVGQRLLGDHPRQLEQQGGPGSPFVRTHEFGVLDGGGVVGRGEDDEILGGARNHSDQVLHGETDLAVGRERHGGGMDLDPQVELRELIEDVGARPHRLLGPRHPGPERHECLQVPPGALRREAGHRHGRLPHLRSQRPSPAGRRAQGGQQQEEQNSDSREHRFPGASRSSSLHGNPYLGRPWVGIEVARPQPPPGLTYSATRNHTV
jgi:hypothetical protein